METKIKKSGGKRNGAGRKRKYTAETKTLTMRVPIHLYDLAKSLLSNFINDNNHSPTA